MKERRFSARGSATTPTLANACGHGCESIPMNSFFFGIASPDFCHHHRSRVAIDSRQDFPCYSFCFRC